MKDIILVGYGGHAKSVADCIERSKEYNIVGYTDLCKYKSPYEYLGTDDVLKKMFENGVRHAVVGVGYLGKGKIRETLYNQLKSIGYKLPVIADPSAIVSSTATIEEGTFIGKSVIVNAEAKIGAMAIINSKALVEHECELGDFSHVAVGAVLCGQVKVGRGAFVGANATVIQCRTIKDYSVIPAGITVR